MGFSNTLDAARRAFLGFVRGVVYKVDDTPLMQTINAKLLQRQ